VFVQGWQVECCGAAFSVGDEVSWGLAFTEADGGAVIDAEQLVELTVDAHRPAPTPSKPWGSPVVLTVNGLTLYWSTPNEPAGRLVVRGMVLEDHHALVPEDGVRTAGVVRRIQLATQTFALAAGAQSRRELTYRDVGACPISFRSAKDGAVLTTEVGVLVDLETADADATESAPEGSSRVASVTRLPG